MEATARLVPGRCSLAQFFLADLQLLLLQVGLLLLHLCLQDANLRGKCNLIGLACLCILVTKVLQFGSRLLFCGH